MELRRLDAKQIKYVYHNHLQNTFPAEERRPLNRILHLVKSGKYECLGMCKETEIVGYAFLVKYQKNYLIDYLGVCEAYRNQGIGSAILKKLADYYQDADCITVEIEDPAYAITKEDRQLRIRRHNFYLRNGYKTTDVKVLLFGVDFLLAVNADSKVYTKTDVADLYKTYYRITLPRFLYWLKVKIKRDNLGS